MPTDFSNPEWNTLFDDLMFDLRKRACVLLIGPEAVEVNGRPVAQELQEILMRDYAGDIEHYFEKDALYLFKGPGAKSNIQRGVGKYYDRAKPDPAIFQTVAAIPFPLVVTINPDEFLAGFLKEAGVRFNSAYFNHGAGSNGLQELAGWEGDTTLVYNLCGHIESDASLVLDYDDLFSFLKNVLGAAGLPDPVRRVLKKAKSFLFVGFQFDKWPTQLLLRLLNEDSSPAQLALDTQLGETDARQFLLKRFNMKFLNDQPASAAPAPDAITGLAFLQELGRRWQAAQAADGEDLSQPDAGTVRRLVEKGDVEKALTILLQITANEDRDMATMYSSWFHTWKREKEKGAEDSRTLENRYNKVLNGILELLKTLPQ